MKSKFLLSTLASLSITCSVAVAQIYPLSENTWSNPEFVERFLGSYGFDTEKTPSITKEEADVFRQVSSVAGRNPSQAINIIRQNLTPDSSGAMDFALANFLLQERRFGESVASFNNAIRKFPNFYRAYKNLGLAYIQQNDYKNALTNLTKAVEIGGGDGGMYGLIGFCHLNLGFPGSALDAYRFALVMQPDVRDWRLGQLKALQQLRKFDEVEGIIYRYIEESPNQAEFWLQQANAFIAQRKYAQAAANLEIVNSLGGADKESLLLLGDIYVNLESPMLALPHYVKAINGGNVSEKKVTDLAQLVSRLIPPQELDRFIAQIESAMGGKFSSENELTLLTLKAGSALSQDKKAEAMEILTQVVSKDPLNGKALLTLGRYHLNEEQFEEALDFYSRAEKVEKVKVEALLGSARVLVKMGSYQNAITRLKEAQLINDQPFIAQYINSLERFVN